nr:hypothetical protein [Tanacetum cinerariifolium]
MLKAFPLPDYFPTTSEDRFPLLSLKEMPLLKKFALLMKSRYNCGQRRGTPCPIKGVLRIKQYLQNEHYALWEVIEFGDSYEAPQVVADIGSTSEGSAKKKGRTIAVTTEDMQKRRNDVKAEGKETLEQTFNRLDAIVSHLEFMDVEIEEHDLNQKFLTSLAPEWLMYLIVWRNRSDLDTMSLDDLYNHLKVYEPEVQKKSKSNSQNMAFISSAKPSSGKEEVNTASFSTASTQVSPASADVATASFSHDTVCTYIASQSNGSQVKYEDINQIDEDDIKEIDIKWNMALLSMRLTDSGKRLEKRLPFKEAPTEFALMAKSSFDTEVFDNSLCSKACKKNTDSLNTKITELSEKLSDTKNTLYHYKLGLSQVEARLVEFKTQEIKFYEKIRGLEFKVESKDNRIERLTKELEELKKEKEGLDSKLIGFQSASKDLDTLLGSQRSDKNKEGLGYNSVPPSCSSLLTSQERYVLDKIT